MKIVVSLDEDDVKCLIGGGCLTLMVPHEPQQIQIYMKDIGFDRIDKIITDLDTKKVEPYQDLIRVNQGEWQ